MTEKKDVCISVRQCSPRCQAGDYFMEMADDGKLPLKDRACAKLSYFLHVVRLTGHLDSTHGANCLSCHRNGNDALVVTGTRRSQDSRVKLIIPRITESVHMRHSSAFNPR